MSAPIPVRAIGGVESFCILSGQCRARQLAPGRLTGEFSMRVARSIAVLSVVAISALGLTACAGNDPVAAGQPVGTEQPVVEPASFDLTIEDFAERVEAAVTAAGTSTVTITTAGMTMTGVTRALPDGTAEISMVTTTEQTGAMEIRFVGGSIYISLEELTGGQFVRIDPTNTDDPLAPMAEQLTNGFGQGSSVEVLNGAILGMEKDGEPEDIEGALAQPYLITVDSEAVLATMDPEVAAAAADTLPEQLSYRYWIDADDLPRRVLTEIAGVVSDSVFSNWGEPVQIEAPSADELVEMPS